MLPPIAIGMVGIRKSPRDGERTVPYLRNLSSLRARSNGSWSLFAVLQPGDEGHRHPNRCDHSPEQGAVPVSFRMVGSFRPDPYRMLISGSRPDRSTRSTLRSQ